MRLLFTIFVISICNLQARAQSAPESKYTNYYVDLALSLTFEKMDSLEGQFSCGPMKMQNKPKFRARGPNPESAHAMGIVKCLKYNCENMYAEYMANLQKTVQEHDLESMLEGYYSFGARGQKLERIKEMLKKIKEGTLSLDEQTQLKNLFACKTTQQILDLASSDLEQARRHQDINEIAYISCYMVPPECDN